MEYRLLGKTGLWVSRLGFGSTSMLAHGVREAARTFDRALELGVNFIDTAPSYSDGADETALGVLLRHRRAEFLVSTKIGYLRDRSYHRDAGCLRDQFDGSLRRLGTEFVDILYIHEADFAWWWRPEGASDIEWSWPFPLIDDVSLVTDEAPVMQFITAARASGKVRFWGLSGKNARLLSELTRRLGPDVVLVAHQLNPLYRNAEAFLAEPCSSLRTGVVVGAPLMRGWLAQVQSDWHSKNPAWMDLSFWNSYSKLVDLGAKSEMPLAELSLRWLISQSFVDSVLVGFGNALEVEEDVAFVRRGALPPSILKEVDHLGIVHPLRYQGREYV